MVQALFLDTRLTNILSEHCALEGIRSKQNSSATHTMAIQLVQNESEPQTSYMNNILPCSGKDKTIVAGNG